MAAFQGAINEMSASNTVLSAEERVQLERMILKLARRLLNAPTGPANDGRDWDRRIRHMSGMLATAARAWLVDAALRN
jgi:hypothetical protein